MLFLLIHLVCELGTAASILATLLDEQKQRKVPLQQYLFFAATLATTLLMTAVNIFGFKKLSTFVFGGRAKVLSGGAVLPAEATYASTTLATYRSGPINDTVSHLSGHPTMASLAQGSLQWTKKLRAEDATDLSDARDIEEQQSTWSVYDANLAERERVAHDRRFLDANKFTSQTSNEL